MRECEILGIKTHCHTHILGEQASNKSAIEEAIERWLVDLRREDDMVREREDKVRDANKRRKANERAQEAPAGVVRIVPITISCSKLLKRLKQSQGHCLYSVCTEAETLLKSNGSGAWAQKWDIYRNAFGRERCAHRGTGTMCGFHFPSEAVAEIFSLTMAGNNNFALYVKIWIEKTYIKIVIY